MSDIVIRLRTWVHAVDAVPVSDLMDEAADTIRSLRDEVAEQRKEIAALRQERSSAFNHERPRPDAAW